MTHTQITQRHAHIDWLFNSVCMFGQVSELYRTGRSIKRIDKASSEEQANRFVELQLHKAILKKQYRRVMHGKL